MPRGFLPNSDSALLSWSRNFAARIAVDYAALGLTLVDVDTFTASLDAYADAYRTASDPGTRTRVAVTAKNGARELLKADARRLARMIMARDDVSSDQRINLGLSVRKAYARIPAPGGSPSLEVRSVNGWIVHLRLRENGLSTRRLPHGVAGANIYAAIDDRTDGQEPIWQLLHVTSRCDTTVQLPLTAPPGTCIWLGARWFNPRHETGPAGNPVRVWVQFGAMQPPARLAA